MGIMGLEGFHQFLRLFVVAVTLLTQGPLVYAQCTWSVGSGTDCTAVTCPGGTGTKYYLQTGADVGAYMTVHPFTTTALGSCFQNSTASGRRFTFEVICGPANPTSIPAFNTTCSGPASITYYTRVPSHPGCGVTEGDCPRPVCAPADFYIAGIPDKTPIYHLYIAGSTGSVISGGGYTINPGCTGSGWTATSSFGSVSVPGGSCDYVDACTNGTCPMTCTGASDSLVRIYHSCTCSATPTPTATPASSPSTSCTTCPPGTTPSGTGCASPATPDFCPGPFIEGSGTHAGKCILNCCNSGPPPCSDCSCNGGTADGPVCTSGPFSSSPTYTCASGTLSGTQCMTSCPVIPPSPAPSASPSPACNYDIGGAGRQCAPGGPTTCCTGYSCEVGGAQPILLDHGCVPGQPCQVGVNFRTGFSSASDAILAGPASFPATTPGTSVTTGNSAVCVDTPTVAAAGSRRTDQDYFHYPNAVEGSIDPAAVRWDATQNMFRCELNSTSGAYAETHRGSYPNGCRCDVGYEPAVLSPAQPTVASIPKTNLQILWAQVEAAIRQNKAAVKAVAKVYDKVVPDANACSTCPGGWTDAGATCTQAATASCPSGGYVLVSGSCRVNCPNSTNPCDSCPPPGVGMPGYCDAGAPTGWSCNSGGTLSGSTCSMACPAASPTAAPSASPSPSPAGPAAPILADKGALAPAPWNPWGSTDQNFGINASGVPIAGAPNLDGGATYRVACVRECPTTDPNPARRTCYSAANGCDPTTCVCDGSPDYLFDRRPGEWKCVLCNKEGQYMDDTLGCTCPAGYALWPDPSAANAKCRPILPVSAPTLPQTSSEYRRGTAGIEEGYPVCGPGRLPVRNDFSIMTVASSSVPRTDSRVEGTGYINGPYPYATPAVSPGAPTGPTPPPHYLYWDYPRCTCAGTVAPTPTVHNHGNPTNPITVMSKTVSGNTVARFVDDTMYSIVASGWNGRPIVPFGPVPIMNDETAGLDPRLGTYYSASSGPSSSCHCPNVNEVAVRLDSTDPLSGSRCVPAVIPAPGDPASIKLITFNRQFHDAGGSSIVMNRAGEAKDSSGNIIRYINMPSKADTYAPAPSPYERGIWVCQAPYTFNPATGACSYQAGDNACDQSSEISNWVSGTGAAQRWGNTVNKKLNCCGFQFGTAPTLGAAPVKFDCIANEHLKFPDFNTLWASKDDDDDGGQLNAIVLHSGGGNRGYGRELTGWYTLDGQRCDQYPSLSATAITPGMINPNLITAQQGQLASGVFQAAGNVRYSIWSGGAWTPASPANTIQMPTGSAWTDVTSKLAGRPGMQSPPNPSSGSAAEVLKARQCPIYVRAAAIYGCQENAIGSAEKRLFRQTDAAGRTKFRCAAASRTQIHVRVEQVFQIMGTKPLQTIDSILDDSQTRTITLKELWEVNGFGRCPAGGKRVGDGCAW